MLTVLYITAILLAVLFVGINIYNINEIDKVLKELEEIIKNKEWKR